MFRPRDLLTIGVLLLIGGMVIDSLLLAGLFQPLRVASGSMAPTLLGPHHDYACPHCRREFAVDASSPPPLGQLLCPSCGRRFQQPDSAVLPGSRLFVDRTAFVFRAPRRWECIVFRDPHGTLLVKRVVGLPGEKISIRDGEVLADGQILRKPLDVLLTMATMVDDSRSMSTKKVGAFVWLSRAESHWPEGFHGTQFTHFRPDGFESEQEARENREKIPIYDESSYNQGESRVLHPVRDLLLRIEHGKNSTGQRAYCLKHGADLFVVTLDASNGHIRLLQNGTLLQEVSNTSLANEEGTLLLCVADQQVILSWNGRVLLQVAYEATPGAAEETASPLAIGSFRESPTEVGNIQVLRDVYYLSGDQALPGSQPAEVQLGPDEFFVLGDNSSASEDSRQWQRGVSREAIFGKPLGVR